MLKLTLIVCLFLVLWVPLWKLMNWIGRIFEDEVGGSPAGKAARLDREMAELKAEIDERLALMHEKAVEL